MLALSSLIGTFDVCRTLPTLPFPPHSNSAAHMQVIFSGYSPSSEELRRPFRYRGRVGGFLP